MKIIQISVSAAALATALTGCGTQQKQPAQAPAPQAKTEAVVMKTVEVDSSKDAALEAEYAKLPTNVILRVQKDSDGNEIAGTAEMVSLKSEVIDGEIEAAFAKGTALSEAKNSDSLDGDSSAESWYGPNGFNGAGYNAADYNSQTTINYSNINYGNQYDSANFGAASGYGNNAYGAGWGTTQNSNGWNNYGSIYAGGGYRPMVQSHVYGGAYWQYGRPNCYNYGNLNYYWYPRPRCGHWGFCR